LFFFASLAWSRASFFAAFASSLACLAAAFRAFLSSGRDGVSSGSSMASPLKLGVRGSFLPDHTGASSKCQKRKGADKDGEKSEVVKKLLHFFIRHGITVSAAGKGGRQHPETQEELMDNAVDDLLRRLVEVTGIHSQMELARVLEIDRSGITHARKNNRIPDKWVMKLYRSFGLNPLWVETGRGEALMDGSAGRSGIRSVPKVKARLCAGSGSFEVGQESLETLQFRSDWLSRKGSANHMVAMEVFGNSMEPELREGDTVLIDQSQTGIIAGAIYALGIEDTIMVKRMEKHPNKLVLCSDNRDYAPIYLNREEMDTVRVIGKVIWSCREYR
jgi:phage repressor protein C with HTH and peptisase S24 domain